MINVWPCCCHGCVQTVLSQVRKENEAADLEYVGRAAEQAVRKLQAKVSRDRERRGGAV